MEGLGHHQQAQSQLPDDLFAEAIVEQVSLAATHLQTINTKDALASWALNSPGLVDGKIKPDLGILQWPVEPKPSP